MTNERELSAVAKSMGREFREMAMDIDIDRSRISRYLESPALRVLSSLGIEEPYNRYPLQVGKQTLFTLTARQRALLYEGIGYGDIGATLACPGPSMSGAVVAAMASPAQKERYFSVLWKKPTWTFFAMSEPSAGSDATNLGTRLTSIGDGRYLLNGEKYFIGNGALSEIGVVFAKRHSGPLGSEIVLIEPPRQPKFESRLLDPMGVRGSFISHLKFTDCEISEDDILGNHLNPSEKFKMAGIRTFSYFRPSVAMLGLGVAQAAYDYILDQRTSFKTHEQTWLNNTRSRLKATRALILRACDEYDSGEDEGALAAVAKFTAVALAEEVTAKGLSYLGKASFFDHPLLNKWYRDCRALEYMEGTTHIQKLNTFQFYRRGKLGAA